jgi:hypothetical protein
MATPTIEQSPMTDVPVRLLSNVVDMLVLTPWELIAWSMALGFVSLGFHQLGHSVVARLCGVDTVGIRVGVGPGLRWQTSSGFQFALGIYPLSGQVSYSDRWHHTSALQMAAISAGGWLADLLVFLCLLCLCTFDFLQSPPGKLALLISLVQAVFGLTPFTYDGRALVRQLWLWSKSRAE